MTPIVNEFKWAWLKGALIILVILSIDIIARKMGFGASQWLLYIVWGLFMIAVFVSTYAAPRQKLIVGMSHTLTISALFTASNWIQSLWGMPVDLGGRGGLPIVFALIYVSSFIPALIAAVVGLVSSSAKKNDA